MLPDEAGLVGIPAGIVNGADGVEGRAISGKGMAGHRDDDPVAG